MKIQAILAILIGLIVALFVVSALIPVADDGLDRLSDDYICDQQDGCFYNATTSSTVPCRNDTNFQTVSCPTGDGGTVPFGNIPQTIIIIVIMAGVIIGAIALSKQLGKQK